MQYKRTLIIGDIHGNIRALESALKNANYKVEEDRIICLGDYIDGWKKSYEVVEKLIQLQANSPFEHIYLKGNHDAWFLEVLNQNFKQFRVGRFIRTKYHEWIQNDGLSTYLSYIKRSNEAILQHKISFFDTLKLFHIENEKLFVHAGFNYRKKFQDSLTFYPKSLMWDRSLFSRAIQLWNMEQKGAVLDATMKRIADFEKIYIGHTPTTKYGLKIPQKMGNVINVDQGCKRTGILSIWVDEDDTFYQSSFN